MKYIVLINGEKQSGKSTLAEHAANLLQENGITAQPYSFVEPYEIGLIAMMNHNYGYDLELGDFGFSYEDAKKAPFYPGATITGRDWMIQQGNAARSLDPYLLPGIFSAYAERNDEVDVWLIENWGFQDEWVFFCSDAAVETLGDFRLITVSLTERSSRQYMSGEQYDGDNRFNMDAIASYVNPKVNELCSIIDPDHDYPIDTILQQFGARVAVEPQPSDQDHDEPAGELVILESELDNQPSEALPTAESETNLDHAAARAIEDNEARQTDQDNLDV